MVQKFGGRAVAARPTGAEDERKVAALLPEIHRLGQSLAYRERVRRLHQLGPRPVGELLGEIVAAVPDAAPVLAERLEVYASLDPRLIDRFDAGDWLEPRDLMRVVAEGSA